VKSRAEYKRQLRAKKRALLPPQTCYRCGQPMNKRHGAKFCSDACRQPLSPEMADKWVKRYFRNHPRPTLENLPATLGELLRAIGLTAADARALSAKFGRYYFRARIKHAWPALFPPGQEKPAVTSTWNNIGRAFERSQSLYLKEKSHERLPRRPFVNRH
jgi:hypothetical protein